MEDIKISKNFSLYEFLRSRTAGAFPELREKQYNPSELVVINICNLVTNVFQPLREEIGIPIKITSGYRCPSLNKMLPGASQFSSHLVGKAADAQMLFDVRDKSHADRKMAILGSENIENCNYNFALFTTACKMIKDLPIDTVIHEHGTVYGRPDWVHIATSDNPRRRILAIGCYTDGHYREVDWRDSRIWGYQI